MTIALWLGALSTGLLFAAALLICGRKDREEVSLQGEGDGY